MRARAVTLNWVEELLGSDPNSGQSLRAGQRGLLGSDRNFEQAEGGANLGYDPNNPDMPSAVASNCVVEVDALLSVFILAPLSHPRLSLAPPGEKEEPTAIFGRVLKQRKYTCRCALRQENRIFIFPTCLSNWYFFALNTRPNMAVGPLFRPAGRERAGRVSGAKNENE